MQRFEGRVAVVTAGGSGMGRAIVERLAAEGATVVAVDIDEQKAKETADRVVTAGGSATAAACDVTAVDQLRALFERVAAEHGILHVLHNQVGVPGAPGVDVSEAEFQRVVDLNTKSAWFGTSLALPLLRRAAGKASITYTASTSALVGSPFAPLYSLTKTALVGYVRSLALALGPEGIRANVVCPGPTDTPMLPTFFRTDDPAELEARKRQIMDMVPLRRMASPAEIASVVAFLASDDAAMVTGVAIPVDGGLVAG